ncbi:TetR family transcriptional regulator [Antrihabitans spumae]|uniref:TetR family transcriptional regulator n=1 Tax=Antrihabitans spumae TaxID=3373370 RepID=A0ABW7KPE1_9NOCA
MSADSNEDKPDGGRTGRRPGQSGTREAILDSARERFAQVGFDKASIRSIAAGAGVDSALVHHYFGTKQELLVSVAQLPVDPQVVLAAVNAASVDELGEQLLRAVVGAWDGPAGVGILAAFRGVMAGADPSLIRTFLLEIALKGVRDRVDVPAGTGQHRVALAASQVLGILVARKMILLEPIASMPIDELVELAAPTLQRYFTGDIF